MQNKMSYNLLFCLCIYEVLVVGLRRGGGKDAPLKIECVWVEYVTFEVLGY